jgi:hypothetical protein
MEQETKQSEGMPSVSGPGSAPGDGGSSRNAAGQAGASPAPASAQAGSGWSQPLPRPEDLPRPTYWPFVLAVGIMFALGGIVTFYPISLVGVGLIVVAMGGWVGELRHE